MSDLHSIPEIQALDHGTSAIRIPDQQQVPTTSRIRNLIETSEFQRLRHISQLGLVSLVYPGATHSRFEHSLGVYRMALLFLKHFALDAQFSRLVSARDAELLIVSALLHDVAHWPFCHPIEDLELDSIPPHEVLFATRVAKSGIPELLKTEWGIETGEVAQLLQGTVNTPPLRILNSILSGPIDVDKMDYLYRDSLHSGVPYGKNFDQQRLIASLCLDRTHDKICINEKGRTAAELMVFARYVMFSEVYWHHAVRSATAMLQRAFFELKDELPLEGVFDSMDSEWINLMIETSKQTNESAHRLLIDLFGDQRRLYKRLAQFSCFEHETLYRRIARQPYRWLVEFGNRLAEIIGREMNQPLPAADLLIDAPPVGLEVQFNISVRLSSNDEFRSLGELSPVVRTLATHQFDDYVKRVRIFISPRYDRIDDVRTNIGSLVERALDQCS